MIGLRLLTCAGALAVLIASMSPSVVSVAGQKPAAATYTPARTPWAIPICRASSISRAMSHSSGRWLGKQTVFASPEEKGRVWRRAESMRRRQLPGGAGRPSYGARVDALQRRSESANVASFQIRRTGGYPMTPEALQKYQALTSTERTPESVRHVRRCGDI
jgi:hypothetical protein